MWSEQLVRQAIWDKEFVEFVGFSIVRCDGNLVLAQGEDYMHSNISQDTTADVNGIMTEFSNDEKKLPNGVWELKIRSLSNTASLNDPVNVINREN